MTLLTHNERIILRRLDKASKDKPAPLSELTQLLKCEDRDVKHDIKSLRQKGVCIVAIRSRKFGKKPGYFIPQNETERREGMAPFIRQIESEIEIKDIMLNADLNAHKQLLEVENE